MRQLASRLWVTGLVLLALPAAGVIEPEGGEARLNVNTESRQLLPALAASAAGPAVVWEHERAGIRGVFLAPGGATTPERTLVGNSPPSASPFRGNVVTRRQPAAAFGADGNLALVWTEERAYLATEPFYENRVVEDRDILVQRFDRSGTPLARRFRVNATAAGMQHTARIAAHADGFVVVWQEEGGLFARSLDAAGRPRGVQTRVSNVASQLQALAVSSEGKVLVVWDAADEDESGVFARLLGGNARPLGPTFRVNTTTQYRQGRPTVAADGAGGFLVAWQSEHPEQWNGFFYLYGQAIGADGAAVGPQLRLYEGSLAGGAPQIAPALASGSSGGFLLSWITWSNAWSVEVAGLELDALGAAVGDAFWVTERRIKPSFRDLAAVADGDGFLVVWESNAQKPAITGRHLAAN